MSEERKFYVYMHVNKINHKKYIGITGQERIQDRWRSDGSGYKTQVFGRAIQKYGWENFEHIILERELSEEEALEKEKYYIERHNTTNPDYGYNISKGGDIGTWGVYNNGLSIPVYAYTIDGLFIGYYPSMMEAERQTGIDNSAICACCKKKILYISGYRWFYDYQGEYIEPIDPKQYKYITSIQKQEKPVYCYNLDGSFKEKYKSLSEAHRQTGCDLRLISACCLGKRKMHGDYMWFYTYQGGKIDQYTNKFSKKYQCINSEDNKFTK